MPVFQIEMLWQCSACKDENKGRFKKCQNCGKAKEGEPFYDAPGTESPTVEDAVTDPALVRQATAGSDWECKYCRSHQRRDDGSCSNCGAKQGYSKDHETRWDDGTVGASGRGLDASEEVELEIAGAQTGTGRPTHVRKPRRTSTPVTVDPLEECVLANPGPWRDSRKRLIAVLAVVVAAAVAATIFYFLFRTKVVAATVVAVSWEAKVSVERRQIARGEGFGEGIPGDAFDVEDTGRRHHHDDKVLDGYDREPYEHRYKCGEDCRTTLRRCTMTPVTCTSNKNGYKTCSGGDERCTGGDRKCDPKYCTETRYKEVARHRREPVYETWYRWKAWRWFHNRNVVESGVDNEPRWPTEEAVGLNRGCSDGEQEREARSSSHLVTFEADSDKHKYVPRDLTEFRRLTPGSKFQLKISVAGSPEILREAH